MERIERKYKIKKHTTLTATKNFNPKEQDKPHKFMITKRPSDHHP